MLKRRVEQVSDTSLEPGTFYGALARLEKDGLVIASSRNVSARVYSLTERGQEALQRHRYILQERRERLEPAARESFFKERTMRLASWLVKLYPQAWRRRYEEEMLMVLEGYHITFLTLLDLLFGALNACLDPHYRSEGVPVSFKRKNAAVFAFIAGMALSILCMHSWYVQSVTFLSFPSDVHLDIPIGSIMNQMSGYVIYLMLVAGNALIFTSFI